MREIVASLLLLLALTGCASRAAQPAATAPGRESLVALNDAFRRVYGDAKQRMLAEAGPVIIVKGDTAVLLRDGRRVEADVNVPVYHSLKAIAHVPLGIYAALTPGEGPLDAERLRTLERLDGLIRAARPGLAGLGLSATALARQEEILAQSLAFLDDVRARREFRRAGLEAFTHRMAPLVMGNVRDAARAQLDALHARVAAWRSELGPAEWERLHVVIVAAHMPREGEVTFQYWSRLLREPVEGRRIVYAEAQWEEPRALDLLAQHLLDGSGGEAFFGDFMRMHRDLLADEAREYLPSLLPR